MSNEDRTDYTPGDPPVPVGSIVEYRDGEYEVVAYQDPREGTPDPEVHYPDGVAYLVHIAGQPKKFGSEGWVSGVRRRSFRVKAGAAPPKQED
jgi:hypothetical protein